MLTAAMLATLMATGAVGRPMQEAGAAPDALSRAHDLLARFQVRDGYELSVAVPDLDEARFLETDDRGTLFVSQPRNGGIVALRDRDGDGVFETRSQFVSGYPSVHGMDWHDGWLWFATSGGVFRARDTDDNAVADEIADVIKPGQVPAGGGHWWRSVLVTDESIYTGIGDSGNITDETELERQKIYRFDADGSNKRLFASGIRNTEKLRFRPGTDEVWGFDHGSDWFGLPVGDEPGNQPITNLQPPDELNHYREGRFYGHPFITGAMVPRYEYLLPRNEAGEELPNPTREQRDAQVRKIHEWAGQTVAPEWPMPAHCATNGFVFIDPEVNGRTGTFPPAHSGDILVACHGSWNATAPVGYSVSRVLFDDGRPYGRLDIVTCIGQDGRPAARPVDCVQMPDGSVLFSIDAPVGAVFRIRGAGNE